MPPPLRAAAAITLRPMTDDDLDFTRTLYASTRWEELAAVPWSDAQKLEFLAQQHGAQHTHYRTYYDGAEWLIVERGGVAIGRLYLHDQGSRMAIVDISLLPAARGQGIGGALLRDVCDWAASLGKSVSIHVEKINPARHLYERLGFALVEDKDLYDRMEWTPPTGG